MPSNRTAGFWSFTHEDDTADGGRIVNLARKIQAEYEILTGQELELFIDREAIGWGDEWRSRIDSALSVTTFFIPVITRRYFQRPECRGELLTFIGHAKSLGMEELLLPILYAEVPELTGDEQPADEAISAVKAMQWEDWRKLRLADENSENYRQSVHRLANRLMEINQQVAVSSVVPAIDISTAEAGTLEEAPGLLEVLAAGESALARWAQTLEEFAPLLEGIGTIATNAAEQMARSDDRGGGFSGRLAVGRKLANELEQPAGRVAELGHAFASDLVEIDSMVLAAIRLIEEDPSQLNDEARSFFLVVRNLATDFSNGIIGLEAMAGGLDNLANLSRDLRRPAMKMQVGLQGVRDAQSVIAEWQRRIDLLDESFVSSAQQVPPTAEPTIARTEPDTTSD